MLTLTDIDRFIQENVEGIKPSPDHLSQYRKQVGAENHQLKLNSRKAQQHLRDAVVFVADRPSYYFLRLSQTLRKRNTRTILVTRWGVESKQCSFFDHIMLYDKIQDLKHLDGSNNCLFYVLGWTGWKFLPVYVQKITGQSTLCHINDLTSSLFKEFSHYSLLGLSEDERKFDFECERFILEKFDRVTLPYQQRIFKHIKNTLNGSSDLGENSTFFPVYPYSDFLADVPKDNKKPEEPLRFIFMGGVPPDRKPDRAFKDQKIQGVVKSLLQTGSHVSIFNNPQLMRMENDIKESWNFFTKLSQQDDNFEFRAGFPPWELQKHTQKFDYGLMLYCFEDVVINESHYRNIVPSKFFTYIEQGLPVLVSEEMRAVCDLVKEHGLGLVISHEEIASLAEKIKQNDEKYNQFLRNIAHFRSNYSMDKMLKQHLSDSFSDYVEEFRP